MVCSKNVFKGEFTLKEDYMKKWNKLKAVFDSKANIKILIGAAFLCVLFWGTDYFIEYAADSYSTLGEGDSWRYMLYENGRAFNALIYYLIEKIHLSNGIIYKLTWSAAMFFLWASASVLGIIYNKYIRNEILSTLSAFLILVNPFLIELFLFIEKGLFLFAIFCCVIAFALTLDMMSKNKFTIGKIAAIICLLLLTTYIYQILLAVYVILCLPFIVYYAENLKRFLGYNLFVGGCYGFNLATAYLLTRFVLGSSRISSSSITIGQIAGAFWKLSDVFCKKFWMWDKGWLIILYAVIAAACCLSGFLCRRQVQHEKASAGFLRSDKNIYIYIY